MAVTAQSVWFCPPCCVGKNGCLAESTKIVMYLWYWYLFFRQRNVGILVSFKLSYVYLLCKAFSLVYLQNECFSKLRVLPGWGNKKQFSSSESPFLAHYCFPLPFSQGPPLLMGWLGPYPLGRALSCVTAAELHGTSETQEWSYRTNLIIKKIHHLTTPSAQSRPTISVFKES